MIREYGYEEYLKNALTNPTQKNINTLAEWFEAYGSQYWNGEQYIIDKDTYLKPAYDADPYEWILYSVVTFTH